MVFHSANSPRQAFVLVHVRHIYKKSVGVSVLLLVPHSVALALLSSRNEQRRSPR